MTMTIPSSSPIKVGIAGYGFSARTFHLPFINLLGPSSYKVVAFLQRNDRPNVHGKPGSSCEEDYPEAKRYKTEEEFFGDEEVELVIITTGHDTHARLAIGALKAGKHVVVEKPFAKSVEEADEVIRVSKESGKILTVFQSRRYDSDFKTLKKVIQTVDIGEILECEFHFDWPLYWPGMGEAQYKPGDGVMFGLGSHTIDQAIVLFGTPETVTGFYRTMPGKGSNSDVGFTILMRYKDDLLVTVKTMMGSMMEPNLKYFARGTEGSFIKFGWDPQEEQLVSSPPISPSSPSFGVEDPSIYGTLTKTHPTHAELVPVTPKSSGEELWRGKLKSERGDLGGFYRELEQALRGKGELVVKPEESRDGLRVIELGRESADKGVTLRF